MFHSSSLTHTHWAVCQAVIREEGCRGYKKRREKMLRCFKQQKQPIDCSLCAFPVIHDLQHLKYSVQLFFLFLYFTRTERQTGVSGWFISFGWRASLPLLSLCSPFLLLLFSSSGDENPLSSFFIYFPSTPLFLLQSLPFRFISEERKKHESKL